MSAVRTSVRAVAASLMLALGACATDNVVDLSAPTFIDQPVYRFAVSDIRIVDEFQPSFDGRHVEHQFPTSPARGAGIWANDRLKAVGQQGALEFIIKDASVIEEPGKDFDRYNAVLEVDMRLYDGVSTLAMAESHSRVTLARSIKSTASITKREDMFAQMTRDLLKSLNVSLENNLRQHFGRYIVSVGGR